MHLTKLNKRVWVKGLALECPLGQALDDCPLNGLRMLSTAQVNHAINSLNDEQISAIAHIHQHCFHERLTSMTRVNRTSLLDPVEGVEVNEFEGVAVGIKEV